MAYVDFLKKVALSFAETQEEPHFEKTSFRIKNKIFATYDSKENNACLKLSIIDQHVFSSYNPKIFAPLPNKWGLQGWTIVNMALVAESMLQDALQCAYNEVAPKKLRISPSV